MSLFKSWKSGSAGASGHAAKDAHKKKEKEEPKPELTPLEKMLLNSGALRQDGSDKFFGLENFGNTCYCNSMIQALYYTTVFRENVLGHPSLSPTDTPNGEAPKPRTNVQIRAPSQTVDADAQSAANKNKNGAASALPGQPIKPEDKPNSPEYKKKQAMLKGPILELAQENPGIYGDDDSTFTTLQEIFIALAESNSRTGVLSPQRFLEIFKRDNEMFRNSMHQDAHEFYGLVLNDVITTVESYAQRMLNQSTERASIGEDGSLRTALGAIEKAAPNGVNSPGTGWVHNIFEGLLVSETKCLTCETASQRDETFLDLSIDLEEHTSVTSCLQKFSAEEMLCERNKFHCDHCGGLQEAEKRMKIKRLPKVLALHLKRFKYTEDYSRLQKLFHRVTYPYQLRMFNTTEDAEDPDRLYELYAVVIHIGGNAYHGHYVSVIKTPDRGWLLFDDEMVEPVDKHYVRNFFGDKPGMACAYVLFYQETTFEKVRAEQEAEGLEEVRIAGEKADVAQEDGPINGPSSPLTRQVTQPMPLEDREALARLDHAATAPEHMGSPVQPPLPNNHLEDPPPLSHSNLNGKAEPQSKEERAREKKEAKENEKARKHAEKEEMKAREKQRRDDEIRARDARRLEQESLRKVLEESRKTFEEEGSKRHDTTDSSQGEPSSGTPHRSSTQIRKSMTKKSFAFLHKDRSKRDSADISHDHVTNGDVTRSHTDRNHGDSSGDAPKKRPFSFGLGRKKSKAALS